IIAGLDRAEGEHVATGRDARIFPHCLARITEVGDRRAEGDEATAGGIGGVPTSHRWAVAGGVPERIRRRSRSLALGQPIDPNRRDGAWGEGEWRGVPTVPRETSHPGRAVRPPPSLRVL